jgi:hypothetical protein
MLGTNRSANTKVSAAVKQGSQAIAVDGGGMVPRLIHNVFNLWHFKAVKPRLQPE